MKKMKCKPYRGVDIEVDAAGRFTARGRGIETSARSMDKIKANIRKLALNRDDVPGKGLRVAFWPWRFDGGRGMELGTLTGERRLDGDRVKLEVRFAPRGRKTKKKEFVSLRKLFLADSFDTDRVYELVDEIEALEHDLHEALGTRVFAGSALVDDD